MLAVETRHCEGCDADFAAGQAEDDHAYVLADASGQMAPPDWARRARGLYHDLRADRIVWAITELMVVPMKSFGIYQLYRQMAEGRARRAHCGSLRARSRSSPRLVPRELEDQMCGFTTAFDRRTAGYSPGRVGALVNARQSIEWLKLPIADLARGSSEPAQKARRSSGDF